MSNVPKSVAKTLLSNPAVRRVIVRNGKRVVTSATKAIAARTEKKSSSSSSGSSPGVADSIAVKNLVTSMAKPVAERLATTETGRSLLETVHKISADALGTSPKRSESPLNTFVTRLARTAGAPPPKTAPAQQPEVKFTPLQPPPPPAGSQGSAVKWPPPNRSAADAVSSSDTDTARG